MRRPGWATLLALSCGVTIVFLVYRDLLIPHVRDTEVWFGFELRGRAARLTAPLHWSIFALFGWGYHSMRPWVWPWASVYAFYIAVSHLVWNLVSDSGGGWPAGLWQLALFMLPAIVLLWARPRRPVVGARRETDAKPSDRSHDVAGRVPGRGPPDRGRT